jgi:uncharacterized protein (TIGR00730 family)
MPAIVDLENQIPPKQPLPDINGKSIQYVAVFGDSAIDVNHPVYKSVYEMCKLLAKKGYGIVNGGGPGVMEAATSGAEAAKGKTVAIYWEPKLAAHFEGKQVTNIADESTSYSNYMMRTLGLIETGHVFVACQGGTGTISEFGMVWALAKLYFGKHKPVILYGDFWHKIVDAFVANMLIDDEELGALYFADQPQEVVDLIEGFELEIQARQERHTEGDELAFVLDARSKVTHRSYDKVAKIYHSERAGKLVAQAQLDEFMSLVRPGKVLDIGTGPGYDLSYLSQKFQMTGIEVSTEMAKIAQFENPESYIINGDIVTYDLPKNEFEGIWSRDTLHHIPAADQNAVFKKISQALKPGGIFYLIVQKGTGERIIEESREQYALKRFYHYYTQKELENRGHHAGLQIVNIERSMRSHEWWAVIYRKKK